LEKIENKLAAFQSGQNQEADVRLLISGFSTLAFLLSTFF
jgi:hypothetical protein